MMALLTITGGELNVAKVEAALNASPQSKKSQQKFLRPDSTDTDRVAIQPNNTATSLSSQPLL